MELEDLPDHVIHQIMHFLPYEEATKFSVLSRSFNSYWLSFPTLNFSYKSTLSEDVSYQTFFNIVQKTLQSRGPYIKGSLHNLSLSYNDKSSIFPSSLRKRGRSDSNSYRQVFDVLLNFAVENNVKEINFDIIFHGFSQLGDIMNNINVTHDSLLPLFSSQFLTVLKLTGIKILPFDAFMKCPKLTELLFKSCDGFQTINVSSSSSLKQFEVKWCKGLQAIQILDGKSLQSFKFEGYDDQDQQCTLDISDCLAVRVLKLTTATTITDEWLKKTIQGLSYLEELEICNCNLLEKIEFEKYSLKRFSLFDCLELKEVVVDVPNLLEFDFNGSIEYPICILSAKCNGNILLPYGISNLVLVKEFLSCFDHFKDLSLSCFRFEYMIVPRHDMQLDTLSALYDLRHIKLEAIEESLPSGRTLTKLLEGLLWLMPRLQTITLYSHVTKTTSTLKFKYGKKVESKNLKVGDCCYDVLIKCWRHYELKIEFEGFDEYVRKYLENFFASSLRNYGIYRDS
ncbi:uncharacterized protein LOC114763158 [Neltuma alba]|uniref:uncharacterized protein LOC114763158 n=1 Tax=Neltuma alba TaxID=207710 RepID=UPI0010A53CA0|nr:uncharacterized protein LOC114763158 [Prosopis alba]